MTHSKFIERRKEYRLPFGEKLIFTDGVRALTAHSGNLSRGGVFMLTLNPFPIETEGYLYFMLPGENQSMCLKAKVVHIVQEMKKCEIECGIGLKFTEVSDQQRSKLNLYILSEQMAYLELKELLDKPRPNRDQLQKLLVKLPWLTGLDLLSMRYRVDRVCAMFHAFADVSELSRTA